MKQLKLSPSKLGDFKRCPRCFWIGIELKNKPPRGIFPGLPGGIDRVLKTYFDKYRGALPPELKGKLPGILMEDMTQLSKWRNWRSGLKCSFEKEAVSLIGALDDCVVDGAFYIPIDNKTKGKKPEDDGAQYYQTQLDCYNLMLRENGYQIRNEGHLVYWYPEEVKENGIMQFGVSVYKLKCDADRGRDIMMKAAECLRGGIPPIGDCELCGHIRTRVEDEVAIEKKEK